MLSDIPDPWILPINAFIIFLERSQQGGYEDNSGFPKYPLSKVIQSLLKNRVLWEYYSGYWTRNPPLKPDNEPYWPSQLSLLSVEWRFVMKAFDLALHNLVKGDDIEEMMFPNPQYIANIIDHWLKNSNLAKEYRLSWTKIRDILREEGLSAWEHGRILGQEDIDREAYQTTSYQETDYNWASKALKRGRIIASQVYEKEAQQKWFLAGWVVLWGLDRVDPLMLG